MPHVLPAGKNQNLEDAPDVGKPQRLLLPVLRQRAHGKGILHGESQFFKNRSKDGGHGHSRDPPGSRPYGTKGAKRHKKHRPCAEGSLKLKPPGKEQEQPHHAEDGRGEYQRRGLERQGEEVSRRCREKKLRPLLPKIPEKQVKHRQLDCPGDDIRLRRDGHIGDGRQKEGKERRKKRRLPVGKVERQPERLPGPQHQKPHIHAHHVAVGCQRTEGQRQDFKALRIHRNHGHHAGVRVDGPVDHQNVAGPDPVPQGVKVQPPVHPAGLNQQHQQHQDDHSSGKCFRRPLPALPSGKLFPDGPRNG